MTVMNFRQSLRILLRNKTYSILNIVGLSIGLAVVLLICLMVYNERSFDKSFKEAGHIYRLNSYLRAYMPGETFASTSNKAGLALQERIPEFRKVVRTYPDSYIVQINDSPVSLSIMWADEDFFSLFDTPFVKGSPDEVMKQPNAIAISESMAEKLFGKEEPMGRRLMLDRGFPVEIKAIYKDYPKNSSFYDYRAVGPFNHSYPDWLHTDIHFGNIDFETFVLLSDNAAPEALNQKIEVIARELGGDNLFYIPRLQSLKDIHLYSARIHGSRTSFQSDIGRVRMLSLLAVIILLVACVNYMNLSTARAQKRSREIGVSKTLGATRGGLILKLSQETGLITAASLVLAFFLAYLFLPVFNSLLKSELVFSMALNPVFLLGSLLIWLLTTLLAASYPALYLSGFPPLLAIRGGSAGRKSGHVMVRRGLTVLQFAVAVVLIAWVFVIESQIRYLTNKDIGYNPHNLISFYVPESKSAAMAEAYASLSRVEIVSRGSAFLFNGNGNSLNKNREDKTGLALTSSKGDKNFIKTLQLKLIAGADLPDRLPGDTITQAILNRKAVEYLDYTPEEIIGKEVLAQIGEGTVRVCGVVENFNFEPLYLPVRGYCIHNGRNRGLNWLTLRVKPENMTEQLNTYEAIYKKYDPNGLFTPVFPEEWTQKAYEAERRTNKTVICFSILAIFVACMGVFGLTAFMAEQRTREIGIRKVMGAGVYNIVSLFTADYLKLLGISLVVALPVAWWLGNNYLDDFAYRISLSWWMFAVAALITIVITITTVCLQAIRAALADPAKAIKTE